MDNQAVPQSPKPVERPDPQWVRGRCPKCGDDLISEMLFTPGEGYIIRWNCWSNRGNTPTCDYRRVL